MDAYGTEWSIYNLHLVPKQAKLQPSISFKIKRSKGIVRGHFLLEPVV